MRVEVYRNLHTGLMSVRECGGRVLTHEAEVFVKDAKFVVQPAGRAKVLREQRKNVHAFVRGELEGFSQGCLANYDEWEAWPKVTYNPYKADHFYPVDLGSSSYVRSGSRVVVTTHGVYYKVF